MAPQPMPLARMDCTLAEAAATWSAVGERLPCCARPALASSVLRLAGWAGVTRVVAGSAVSGCLGALTTLGAAGDVGREGFGGFGASGRLGDRLWACTAVRQAKVREDSSSERTAAWDMVSLQRNVAVTGAS